MAPTSRSIIAISILLLVLGIGPAPAGPNLTERLKIYPVTANAIAVAELHFSNGQRLDLKTDWGSCGAHAAFLAAARDSACTWFVTTHAPDYNDIHVDHSHLQALGRGTCR